MSDYILCTVSGSPAPDPTTGLCVVTDETGTVLGPYPAFCELPEAGWMVWVEKRGATRQDWVITDIQTPTSIRRTFSRYTFGRTANGIASGSTIHLGTPGNTPWSTGSNSTTDSLITLTADCFISITASCSGQGVMQLATTGAAVTYADGETTQGGGVYRQVLNYAGLVLNGETIDLNVRNTSAGLINYVTKTLVTYCDAHWVVAQT